MESISEQVTQGLSIHTALQWRSCSATALSEDTIYPNRRASLVDVVNPLPRVAVAMLMGEALPST